MNLTIKRVYYGLISLKDKGLLDAPGLIRFIEIEEAGNHYGVRWHNYVLILTNFIRKYRVEQRL